MGCERAGAIEERGRAAQLLKERGFEAHIPGFESWPHNFLAVK